MNAATLLPPMSARDRSLNARSLGPYGENDSLDARESGARSTVLRHTMMNPYLVDVENGISCIDRYFEFLARHVRATVSRAQTK